MNFAKTILSAFIITLTYQNASAKIEAVLGNTPLNGNPNLISSTPFTNESEIIISREQYVISYNKNNRSPNWVAWKLDTASMGSSGRTNNFQTDADLEQYLTTNNTGLHAVNNDEYKGSCFDRGHQTPSADRTASAEDNNATFVMSNMAPQTPYLNRVVWEHLESYTRNYVKTNHKKAYIISGPIYDDNYGSIGPNKDIRVPSKEFKIIYFIDENKSASDIDMSSPSITVIMPNVLKDGSKPDFSNGCKPFNLPGTTTAQQIAPTASDPNDWQQFKANISDVETKAGIKF